MTDDHRIVGAAGNPFLTALEQAVTRAEAVLGPDASHDQLSHEITDDQELRLLVGFDIAPEDFRRLTLGTIAATLDSIREDFQAQSRNGQLHATLADLLDAIKPHLHSLIYYALLTGEYHGEKRGHEAGQEAMAALVREALEAGRDEGSAATTIDYVCEVVGG